MLRAILIMCSIVFFIVLFFFMERIDNHSYKIIPEATSDRYDHGPMLSRDIGDEYCHIQVLKKQTKEIDKEIKNKFLKLKKECFGHNIMTHECIGKEFGIVIGSCNKKSNIETY